MKQFLIIMMSDMDITNYYITGKSLQDAVVNKLKENVNYFGYNYFTRSKNLIQCSKLIINDWLNLNYFSASEVQYYVLDITDLENIIEVKQN